MIFNDNGKVNKKFVFHVKMRCPVLLTTNTAVVHASSEEEALKIIGKPNHFVISIEKKNASED